MLLCFDLVTMVLANWPVGSLRKTKLAQVDDALQFPWLSATQRFLIFVVMSHIATLSIKIAMIIVNAC